MSTKLYSVGVSFIDDHFDRCSHSEGFANCKAGLVSRTPNRAKLLLTQEQWNCLISDTAYYGWEMELASYGYADTMNAARRLHFSLAKQGAPDEDK